MYVVAEVMFGVCAILIAYTYAGYPLLMFIISRVFPRSVAKGRFEPRITVLITAYNEEKDIRQKIENTLELDYPHEKFDVLVASDGSTDTTDQIVREFENRGVSLFRQEGRVGKTETQNNAVSRASGEIIVFSDATTTYRKDALRHLLSNFADESVGCVAGRLDYQDRIGSGVGNGARNYWNYESLLKRFESRACSLIGVSGCMYAVRKSAYQPMYREACSDFLICTLLYRQGLRTVYEEKAVCFEDTNQRPGAEFYMRVRVISQTFTDLWWNRDMMNPMRSGFYAVQLFSHKVLRYAVPLFLLGAFISSIVLSAVSTVFVLLSIAQLSFYLAGIIGWQLEKSGVRFRPANIPFYFVLGNVAAVAGFVKFLRGERFARWETARGTT